MTEFLILKLEGDSPSEAKITAHVVSDAEPQEAIRQGFDGEGRYAIVDWSERIEGVLAPGPVDLTEVQDSSARAEAVEAIDAAEAGKEG